MGDYSYIFGDSDLVVPSLKNQSNTFSTASVSASCSTCSASRQSLPSSTFYRTNTMGVALNRNESYGQYAARENYANSSRENYTNTISTVSETSTDSTQEDLQSMDTVITKLKKLSVSELFETLEPVLDKDLMDKARGIKSSLRHLIDSYSNEQIINHLNILPKDTIKKLRTLSIPDTKETNAFDWTFQDERLRDGKLIFASGMYGLNPSTQNYTQIDTNVAIGNYMSEESYNLFNVVVNLNYPENKVNHHQVDVSLRSNQLFINIGIYDSENEPMGDLLKKLVPYLLTVTETHQQRLRILFHCHAGISRSSAVAIAYYSKLKGMMLDTTYRFMKEKRPIIRPNNGFMLALTNYLQ